ncbi:UvrD-helicase domain-containing protein, partial [Rickettsiales bacterium]|nr:UvrD-helicase domain-containing protein [Rickettsiales bacterium]
MQKLQSLNSQQKKAVEQNGKPLLILAGAGTGKTKTVISKINYIINQQWASSSQILGLTFTNKAAREMKDRLRGDVPDIDQSWFGTFHSICSRLLRQHYEEAGIQQNYLIADQDTKNQIIKKILKAGHPNEDIKSAKELGDIISRYKENGYLHTDPHLPPKHSLNIKLSITEFYKDYQQNLTQANLLDFDDLILYTTKMLKQNPELKQKLNEKFKYIFVDEYQDTSYGQNELIMELNNNKKTICCVGDEDQSIYSWRGANIKNILNFSSHFGDSDIIRLEQNYRSTNNIISLASALIKNNNDRYDKKLFSELGEGEKVSITTAMDDKEETAHIANEIKKIHNAGGKYSDITILVRSSYQNKSIEDGLHGRNVPYIIVDGVKFYERQEIKDLISYLKFIYSPHEEVAFARIANRPKRGIGDTTVNKVIEFANSNGKNIVDAIFDMKEQKMLQPKKLEMLAEFATQIKDWNMSMQEGYNVGAMAREIINQTNYLDYLREINDNDSTTDSKIENINTFVGDISKYESLQELLEQIALVSETNQEAGDDAVNIMTIHGSKGLEFPIVFLPGWEEDVFPNARAIASDNPNQIEEERRLAYVAITRAKQRLFITNAKRRNAFGQYKQTHPSRFINDITTNAPSDSVERIYTEGLLEEAKDRQNKSHGGYSERSYGNYNKYGGGYNQGSKYGQPRLNAVRNVSTSTNNLQQPKSGSFQVLKVGDKVSHKI